MSQSENPPSSSPAERPKLTRLSSRQQCANGCGFWGSAQTKNMCSKCYKEKFPEEIAAVCPAVPSSDAKDAKDAKSIDAESKEADVSVAAAAADGNSEEPSKPPRKVQKKKHRCWQCRKKIGLAKQFSCQCGYTFCSQHRYPDAHDCEHLEKNKSKYKASLAKANQEVHFKKVADI